MTIPFDQLTSTRTYEAVGPTFDFRRELDLQNEISQAFRDRIAQN